MRMGETVRRKERDNRRGCVGPVCAGPSEHPREVVVRAENGEGLCQTCFHFYNKASVRKARRYFLEENRFQPVTDEGRDLLDKWRETVGMSPYQETASGEEERGI